MEADWNEVWRTEHFHDLEHHLQLEAVVVGYRKTIKRALIQYTDHTDSTPRPDSKRPGWTGDDLRVWYVAGTLVDW